MSVTLFYGSDAVEEYPGIRLRKYTQDFSWGFYATPDREQARRQASRSRTGVINRYTYTEDPSLRILRFDDLSEEWLAFVGRCRGGYIHACDIVEGPMADDTVWRAVDAYLAGDVTPEAFRALVRGKRPARQISFHTMRALMCLEFAGSETL